MWSWTDDKPYKLHGLSNSAKPYTNCYAWQVSSKNEYKICLLIVIKLFVCIWIITRQIWMGYMVMNCVLEVHAEQWATTVWIVDTYHWFWRWWNTTSLSDGSLWNALWMDGRILVWWMCVMDLFKAKLVIFKVFKLLQSEKYWTRSLILFFLCSIKQLTLMCANLFAGFVLQF